MSESKSRGAYDWESHWAALLASRDNPERTDGETARHTCKRCGGAFSVEIGKRLPCECPLCGCRAWNRDGVKFRRSRGV